MVSFWARSIYFSVFGLNEAKEPIWTQLNKKPAPDVWLLCRKSPFCNRAIQWLLPTCKLCPCWGQKCKIQHMLLVWRRQSSSEDPVRAMCWSWQPDPPLTPSFYVTADQAGVNPAWTAWQQIFGGLFPHFKGSFHHVSQVFYNLSSSAPNLFIPKAPKSFLWFVSQCLPYMFGEQAENPVYDKVHSHHSITEYAQLEAPQGSFSPALGTAKDGKYLMCSNLYSASTSKLANGNWSLHVVVK